MLRRMQLESHHIHIRAVDGTGLETKLRGLIELQEERVEEQGAEGRGRKCVWLAGSRGGHPDRMVRCLPRRPAALVVP